MRGVTLSSDLICQYIFVFHIDSIESHGTWCELIVRI